MSKISTSYASYQELLLDLDIFGNIIKSPPIDKEEFRKLLFEEYKRTHHKVSLEDRRYELSDLVSSDFHVKYTSEIELQENEELVELGSVIEESYSTISEVDRIEVPSEIKGYFALDKKITDEDRLQLLQTLDYFKETDDIEEFTGDEEVVEQNFGTVVEDTSNVYEDEEEDIDYNEDEEEYIEDDSDSEEESDEEDDYEDAYDNDEDDSDEEVEDDSDDSEDDYVDDYDSDEYEDDYEDSEEDYSDEDDDEEDFEEGTDEEDYSDEDDMDYDSDDEEEEQSEQEEVQDSVVTQPKVEVAKESNNKSTGFVDSVFNDSDDDVIEFLSEDRNRKVEVPKVPIRQTPIKKETVKEVVDRDSEPKTLKEFLRKHPHSEVSYVLKYFSKKEVQKEIMMGTVIKKGNKLHI